MPRDRSDYASAVSDSWKRQTLLNIVKLRYLDPPIFVDVGQIVAGYTLQTNVTGGGSFPQNPAFGGNTATVGGSASYTDRPTITYTPLTGNRFLKGLMTPLAPESVFFTIESGWPADAVMMATVASINGLKNQETALGSIAPPDPRFLRVIALMRKLQQSGMVGLRVKIDASKQETALLAFGTTDITPEMLDAQRELRGLLKIDPATTEFKLVFGATASSDKEVAVQTRSILHLMQVMASQVELPAKELSEGRVTPGWESLPDADANRLIRIHCSNGEPSDAFVSISYRNHWFWIDDRDLKTKRTFAFMMMIFTLADTGEKENLPLVTIPAQ